MERSKRHEQDTTKLLLTVEEAASALQICRAMMYQLVMKRQIATIKIGRSRRVPVAALHDFIEQNTER